MTERTRLDGLTVAILTSSDLGAQGGRADESGDRIEAVMRESGAAVVERVMLPDDFDKLRDQLAAWSAQGIRIIITTGGTGLGPRDVMPEVTRSLIDREVPGIAEGLRQESRRYTPMGMLSRGVVGVRHQTLIVNLPGSPKAVDELLPVLCPVLPHVGNLITGHTAH